MLRSAAGSGVPALLWVLSSEGGDLVHDFFRFGANVSFWSVSSSRLERGFRWPTCYPRMSETAPGDLFVVEEERAHPI